MLSCSTASLLQGLTFHEKSHENNIKETRLRAHKQSLLPENKFLYIIFPWTR